MRRSASLRSHLAPYETKEFSQYWYPISKIGTPTFANLNCALTLDRAKGRFMLQTTKIYENVTVKISDGEKVYLEENCALTPDVVLSREVTDLPEFVRVDIPSLISMAEFELGKKAEADAIFSYIANITIEYFSNMHLKELPYWQAKSLMHLGERTKAQHLMTKYAREWKKIEHEVDNGYFGTTPFFISFVDQPKKLRRAQFLYLTSLCGDFTGDENRLAESVALNCDNLFGLFFDKFGFLN